MVQVDDQGRTEDIWKWLEGYAKFVETDNRKGRPKGAGGRLRQAAASLRTLHEERVALAKAVEAERAVMKAEETKLKAEVSEAIEQAKTRPPERCRLPETRKSITRKFKVGGEDLKLYINAGLYEDGRLGEIFIKADKSGSLASGALDAVAMCISIALQYGLPLEPFISKLIGTRFEPSGFTGDKDYPTCTSALDVVGRWLHDKFIELKYAKKPEEAKP